VLTKSNPNRDRAVLRNLALQVVLGLAWFTAMLVTGTAQKLMFDGGWILPATAPALFILPCLVLSPLARAAVGRGGTLRTILVGLGIPLVGAVVVATIVFAISMLDFPFDSRLDGAHADDGLIESVIGYIASGFMMYIVGMPTAVLGSIWFSWYLVFPMGIAHAFALRATNAPPRAPKLAPPLPTSVLPEAQS
jgi:hypothetical protein